jgi:hypothetical protein
VTPQHQGDALKPESEFFVAKPVIGPAMHAAWPTRSAAEPSGVPFGIQTLDEFL